jgi:hypothetical protein
VTLAQPRGAQRKRSESLLVASRKPGAEHIQVERERRAFIRARREATAVAAAHPSHEDRVGRGTCRLARRRLL